MRDEIIRLLDKLVDVIEDDTYALTNSNISELSWKISNLKTEIIEMYKNKGIALS